jgi:hypothetical protein
MHGNTQLKFKSDLSFATSMERFLLAPHGGEFDRIRETGISLG